MGKYLIIWIGYSLGILSSVVNGCTLPSDLPGTWDSSDKGTLYLNSTSMSNYKVYDRGHLSFECIQVTSGGNYIFRSEQFAFFNSFAEAVICVKFEKIKTSMYRYTLYTTELQHADYERVKYVAAGATVTENDACDDLTNTESSLLMQDGALASVKIQCPDTFLGKFTYSLDDNTDCINKTGSMDVCTDLNTMTFNYTACATNVAYSAGGSVNCIYSTTVGSATQLYVYNLDNTTDESTTYRFTCFMFETSGSYVIATQYPKDCQSTQNTTYVASPGKTMEMLASITCVPTTSTSEAAVAAASSLGLVAAAAGVALILIIVGILVSVFIYKKKKQQVDPRIADKGLPPTDTGMAGCLEEVDVTDEVNAILISGSGKNKTEKKPLPDLTPIVRQISLLDSFKSKFFKNSVHTMSRNITDDDKEVLQDIDPGKIIKPQIPCFEIVETVSEAKPKTNGHVEPVASTSRSISISSETSKVSDDQSTSDCIIEEIDNMLDNPLVLGRHKNSTKTKTDEEKQVKPVVNDTSIDNINSYEGDAFEDDDSKLAAKAVFANRDHKVNESHAKIPDRLTLKKTENVLDFMRGPPATETIIDEEEDDDLNHSKDDIFAMQSTWQEDFNIMPMPVPKPRKKKHLSKLAKKKANQTTSDSKSGMETADGQANSAINIPSTKGQIWGDFQEKQGIVEHSTKESSNNPFIPSSARDTKRTYTVNSQTIIHGDHDNKDDASKMAKDKKDSNVDKDMKAGNLTIKSLDSLDLFEGISLNSSITSKNDDLGDRMDESIGERCTAENNKEERQNSEQPNFVIKPPILKYREKSAVIDASKYDNDEFEQDSSSASRETLSELSDDEDDDIERESRDIDDEKDYDIVPNSKNKRSKKSKKKRRKKKSNKQKSDVMGFETPTLDMSKYFTDDDRTGTNGRPNGGIQGLISRIKESNVPEATIIQQETEEDAKMDNEQSKKFVDVNDYLSAIFDKYKNNDNSQITDEMKTPYVREFSDNEF